VLQLWPGLPAAWRFERPRFEQGAWWELLSAQWVHLSLPHALANAAALLLIAWLLRPWLSTAIQCGLLAGAAAGVAAVIALDPGCAYYAGLSGALHGWFGGAAAWLAGRRSSPGAAPLRASAAAPAETAETGPPPAWPWIMLALLVLKVGLESAGLLPSAWSFAVYWPSHAAGLAGGLLAACLMQAGARLASPARGT
jgi:membrane associated rhomboid family serine protease